MIEVEKIKKWMYKVKGKAADYVLDTITEWAGIYSWDTSDLEELLDNISTYGLRDAMELYVERVVEDIVDHFRNYFDYYFEKEMKSYLKRETLPP